MASTQPPPENAPTSEHDKRPYEPPRIEETGSFERLVLACNHQPGGCEGPYGPPSS